MRNIIEQIEEYQSIYDEFLESNSFGEAVLSVVRKTEEEEEEYQVKLAHFKKHALLESFSK